MKVSDFNYDLPDSVIATHPPKVRGASRLLVVDHVTGELQDRHYGDLPEFLQAGDVVVLNDTRVMKSRLKVVKMNGVGREIVILERHAGDDDWRRHRVMYRGSLKAGDKLRLADLRSAELVVEGVLGDGLAIIASNTDLLMLTEEYGSPPLPPYMNRDATPADVERYQTVFADQAGSAAAPTASLNMTKETIAKLKIKGVKVRHLTLHVGLGTFLPIRVETIESHKMHAEYFTIPDGTITAIAQAKSAGGRVVAVGTTVARTLEYALPQGLTTGEADIFIYPGYDFKVVDVLLTNFHAPKSTVLMLTAAFAGWSKLKPAYEYALVHDYKFLSYGDSMLVV
ncbi:MAG: tRNA preQ1(34) S-adenosylmethionine ribosyltransferase-isomerase QueA [Candidatus Nomurabacteria bacterium]|nr:tRNA preQ1(34) S-adenosylmethionine ribosyltransferase-isomerase QueA [Candidatus Nomurabacteria bacterium]